MSGLVEIHSNWVSAKLTPLEEIYLSPFVAAGREIFLHCYKGVKILDGVTALADPPAGSFYEHCVSKLRRQLET